MAVKKGRAGTTFPSCLGQTSYLEGQICHPKQLVSIITETSSISEGNLNKSHSPKLLIWPLITLLALVGYESSDKNKKRKKKKRMKSETENNQNKSYLRC